MNFTIEQLRAAVENSKSYSSVAKKLNCTSGSSWHLVKRLIHEHQVDVSHFLGSRANSGPEHKGGPPKITIENIGSVVRRITSATLRRVLADAGREYRCGICKNDGTWQGQTLTLQVDHVNGICTNNVIENLRYLCPNCHSQTITHGFKGRHHNDETKKIISIAASKPRSKERHAVMVKLANTSG